MVAARGDVLLAGGLCEGNAEHVSKALVVEIAGRRRSGGGFHPACSVKRLFLRLQQEARDGPMQSSVSSKPVVRTACGLVEKQNTVGLDMPRVTIVVTSKPFWFAEIALKNYFRRIIVRGKHPLDSIRINFTGKVPN